MIFMIAAATLIAGQAASRPAADPAALRARVSELEREVAAHLREVIRLAEVAGDTAAARRAHQDLVRLGAASTEERLRLALLSLDAGALEEAHQTLTDLRRANPADLRVLHLLAAVAERAGRAAERDALLKAAAALHPADQAAHLAAGDFLARHGLADQAETEWRRVLSLEHLEPAAPDLEAHLRLANLERSRERYAAAVEHLRAALKLAEGGELTLQEGGSEYLTVQLAMTLRDAHRTDEAKKYLPVVEQFYTQRVERAPSDEEAMNALGWFYAGIGEKLDAGVALAERAVAIAPGRPEFLDTLAELYYRKGDPRRALDLIEKAIAAKPRNTEYYQRQKAKFLRAIAEVEKP